MNISLGGAVSRSTKRGRSPRMPGGSAAANRGVAPSRVGKQVRRRRQGASFVPPPRRALLLAIRRQERCDGHVNQTSHAIGRVELDRWSETRDRRWINDGNNSDAASRQRLWVHQ